MEEEEVVHIKVFDKIKGDVAFMGKVSTNVRPDELVYWKCFLDRGLGFIRKKATNERVDSLKGVHKVDLVATSGRDKSFSGVLYVGVDGVLRKSKSVLLYDCMTMLSVWELSHEECEKAFKCETLEVLEMYNAKMRQIPSEIGKMEKLKRLRFFGLKNLKSIPEEVGQLSSLKELDFVECGIEALPKSLKDLKLLKVIILENVPNLQLCPEDVVLFSKLKQQGSQ